MSPFSISSTKKWKGMSWLGADRGLERIDPQQPFELNLNPPPGTFEEFATRAQKTMVDKIHSKFEQTVVDKIHSFFEQRARSKAKEGIAKAKSVPKDRKDSSDANELEDEGESDSKNESPAEIIGKREAAERDLFRSLVSGETRKDLEPFTRPNFLYYEVPHWQQYLRFLEIRYGPEKTPVEKKHAEETSKKQESSNLDTIGEAYTIGGRPTAPVQRCFFLKLEGA